MKYPEGTHSQDFLTSAFLMTGRDCFYTREAAAELVAAMCDALGGVDLPPPALLKPLQLWTGKQLISALIRPSSRMQCAHTPCHPPAPVQKLLPQSIRLEASGNKGYSAASDG